MLNFINPFSVVTGNRPQSPDPRSLIAHELAHSWSGDATTLGSWEDIWLNEGVTSYLAVRILEVLQGSERSAGWLSPRTRSRRPARARPWQGR